MNLSHKTFATLVGVVLAGLVVNAAYAGGGDTKGGCSPKSGLSLLGGCRDCGCRNDCNVVCRLKKEPLTKKVTCWTSEEEPICLPGPSKRGSRHSTDVSCTDGKAGYEGCCPEKGHSHLKRVVWFEWCIPSVDKKGVSDCSHSCTRKKLMRKEIEVPIKGAFKYSWETVDLCKKCVDDYDTTPTPEEAGADVPTPPPVEARILYGKRVVERMASYNE
ncbi:MAG: hypothetical protein ISR77_18130 [Pirellulaceae bacterium]|nr:hypothetical protein [Pirellulaceae bacterium]